MWPEAAEKVSSLGRRSTEYIKIKLKQLKTKSKDNHQKIKQDLAKKSDGPSIVISAVETELHEPFSSTLSFDGMQGFTIDRFTKRRFSCNMTVSTTTGI